MGTGSQKSRGASQKNWNVGEAPEGRRSFCRRKDMGSHRKKQSQIKTKMGVFPGGPVTKTPVLPRQEARVCFLVRN